MKCETQNKIITTIITLGLGLTLYALFVTLYDTLSLPTVARDYDNNCKWIEVPTIQGLECRACPTELPNRYHWYPVDSKAKPSPAICTIIPKNK